MLLSYLSSVFGCFNGILMLFGVVLDKFGYAGLAAPAQPLWLRPAAAAHARLDAGGGARLRHSAAASRTSVDTPSSRPEVELAAMPSTMENTTSSTMLMNELTMLVKSNESWSGLLES